MLLEISAALARINSISTDLHRQQLHSIQLWVMTSIMYSSTKWKAHVCTPVRRSDGKKQQNLIVPTEWGNEEQIGLDMTVCEEEEEHRGRAWPCLGTGVINQKPFMKLFSVSVDPSKALHLSPVMTPCSSAIADWDGMQHVTVSKILTRFKILLPRCSSF